MPDTLKKNNYFGIHSDKLQRIDGKIDGYRDEYFPKSCTGLCEGIYAETSFFVKKNETCPTEYSGVKPPAKKQMTAKNACKSQVYRPVGGWVMG